MHVFFVSSERGTSSTTSIASDFVGGEAIVRARCLPMCPCFRERRGYTLVLEL
jgi:hypothetical protein